MDDDEKVLQAIRIHIPELRESLQEFVTNKSNSDHELGIREPYIGAYAVISDVLVKPYLLPLLDDDDNDPEALKRCAAAVEQILDARSGYLNDAIRIEVVEYLLSRPNRWVRLRPYAGSLLKNEVLELSKYFVWPYDEPIA